MPVAARDPLHRPVRRRGAQHLKWAGEEIIERQEEELHAGQNHADVRHQFRMFVPIGEQRRKNVNRKQETPEQQRALLPCPDGRELEEGRQRAIAVLHHIGHGEIVGEEKVSEAAEAQPDQHANRHAGVARALDQQRLASDDGGDAAAKRVDSAQKCQKQSKRSKQVQRLSPDGAPAESHLLSPVKQVSSCGLSWERLGRLVAARRDFILRRALGLHLVRRQSDRRAWRVPRPGIARRL